MIRRKRMPTVSVPGMIGCAAIIASLEIDREQRRQRVDLAPFGDAMCEVVEDTRPEVVSFHFGLPAPALLARVKAAGCKVI
jgi:nitronate monooxygenase